VGLVRSLVAPRAEAQASRGGRSHIGRTRAYPLGDGAWIERSPLARFSLLAMAAPNAHRPILDLSTCVDFRQASRNFHSRLLGWLLCAGCARGAPAEPRFHAVGVEHRFKPFSPAARADGSIVKGMK
jgi:hypothetical protein